MLEKLIKEINNANESLPPVHLWDPEHCGDIDIRIKADGEWWHEGEPIRRKQLVNLFSKVLRFDGGEYYLVTPVEKLKIQVDDAPFLAISAERHGEGEKQKICLTTNTGYRYFLDETHPVYVEFDASGNPRPYSIVRNQLKSLLNRSVYMSLVDWGMVSEDASSKDVYGVWSCGIFFELGSLNDT